MTNIANACIQTEHWPDHFKSSISIIIPKPNKLTYCSPKIFRPIILLNTTDKLIEKVISNWLQFHTIANSFLYPNQLGGIQQESTIDMGLYLIYLIRTG